MPSYRVNDAGVTRARELIDAGQYVLDSQWSDAQPDADTENAQLERHGYDGFGQWHLAIDTDAGEETKQRAAQNDHDEVEAAAADLLDRLDEVRADG